MLHGRREAAAQRSENDRASVLTRSVRSLSLLAQRYDNFGPRWLLLMLDKLRRPTKNVGELQQRSGNQEVRPPLHHVPDFGVEGPGGRK
jgi:hypothetical protein